MFWEDIAEIKEEVKALKKSLMYIERVLVEIKERQNIHSAEKPKNKKAGSPDSPSEYF